jgi:tetratricopeptide (TPR) repeat protein
MDKNQKLEKNLKVIMNHFNTGNFDFVISKCKKIIKDFKEYVVLYNILGSAYQQTGRFDLAKDTFMKAIKMDPKNIPIMNNLASTYKQLNQFEKADELFKKALSVSSNNINLLINYGNLKRDINDFNAAIDLYKKAMNINNNLPIVHFALSLAYQGMGDFKLAIHHGNKTISLDPKFTQADKIISQSTKYDLNNEHFLKMKEKIVNTDLNKNQKLTLHFSLAKAYEDIGDLEKSYNELEAGNSLKRETIKYNIDEEILLFENIKKIFNHIDIDSLKDTTNINENIIFILGMPRSGTTLVEQIVSSHTKVFGAGELPYLTKIIMNNFFENSNISFEKSIQISEEMKNHFKNTYSNFLKRFNYKEKFITDKAPLNFRWIGFIKIFFPNAKIIHCVRDPLDNCLSLYKNIFEGGLNFSYNQKELGVFYNLYSDLMNFWHNKYPGFIHDIKYENIVNNQEIESKKIINFCELEWDPKCLEFYKNKTPIKTMSTAQARNKIYKTSIDSFKNFSHKFEKLREIINNS